MSCKYAEKLEKEIEDLERKIFKMKLDNKDLGLMLKFICKHSPVDIKFNPDILCYYIRIYDDQYIMSEHSDGIAKVDNWKQTKGGENYGH